MALFSELKRRKVFRVTSLYAVTAWGASLGAAELFPAFGLSDDAVRWFVIAAVALLPVVILLAWLYELTPNGIERDPADLPSKAHSDQTPEPDQYGLRVRYNNELWTFSQSFNIGRDASCELHLDDPQISRRHARIVLEHGIWYAEDLGSSNGTSLNGEPITRAALPGSARLSLYEGGSDIVLQLNRPDGETTIAI